MSKNNGRNRINRRNVNNSSSSKDRNMGMTIFVILLLVVILGIAIYFYYVNYVNPPSAPQSINNARNQLIKNTTSGKYGVFLQKIEEKESVKEGFATKCVSKVVSKRFQFNEDCDKLKVHKVELQYCKNLDKSPETYYTSYIQEVGKHNIKANKNDPGVKTAFNTAWRSHIFASDGIVTAKSKSDILSLNNCDYDYVKLYEDGNYSQPIHFKNTNNKTQNILKLKPDLHITWSHDGGLRETSILNFNNSFVKTCGRRYIHSYPTSGVKKCEIQLFINEKYSN